MNQDQTPDLNQGLPPAIDQALARSLAAPLLPPSFRAGLRAAVTRAGQLDIAALRQRYEQEQAQRLLDLRHDYIRLRRRTLGSMIGGAFAAGALAALAMPWFSAHFGALAPAIMASAGTAAGLGLGFLAWQRSRAGFTARG